MKQWKNKTPSLLTHIIITIDKKKTIRNKKPSLINPQNQ